MNNIKFRYDKEDDVMMVWLSKEPVDYAEQKKNLIIHFSKKDKPVLMEILNASEFMKNANSMFPKSMRKSIFKIS